MRLVGIPSHEVGGIWPAVRDLVKIAADMSGGRHSIETVKAATQDQRQQLWCVVNDTGPRPRIVAVLITEIKVCDTGLKLCELVLLAGRQRDKWIHLIKDIERWAHDEGCAKIQAMGRQGWVRVMKEWDWSGQWIMIDKDLTAEVEQPQEGGHERHIVA